jgi:two-component system chemotaxis sensor kinase CheA
MAMDYSETLQTYVVESLDHLASMETDLLAIEDAGGDIDEETVNRAFRSAHTIKGGAGFVGLANIKEISHKMESVLGLIRSRQLVPNAEIINFLLLACDALKSLINDISTSEHVDISEHIQALSSITEGASTRREDTSAVEPLSRTVRVLLPGEKSAITLSEECVLKAREEGKSIYLLTLDPARNSWIKDKTIGALTHELEAFGSVLRACTGQGPSGGLGEGNHEDGPPWVMVFACVLEPSDMLSLLELDEESIFFLTEDFRLEPTVTSSEAEAGDTRQVEPVISKTGPLVTPCSIPSVVKEENLVSRPGTAKETGKKAVFEKEELVESAGVAPQSSVRVHLNLLDSLMALAGELVLSRNQLLRAMTSRDFNAWKNVAQRIDLITSELQEAVMLTRMQPMGNVFDRFPRVVRDLGRTLGKEAECVTEGRDVEVDKTILELVSDPLTHLVRNAVAHGIERPDERRKAGKDVTGQIRIRAHHEAGRINIEISDDGGGMEPNELARVAVARNLITEDHAAILSDKEKMELVFQPGFSTVDHITEFSGRGVGMDVVKTNLDKLGGQIDIDSKPGIGTTFRIKLPLTLAIIPCQILLVEGERYAVPQVNLVEFMRIPPGQVKHRVEVVGNVQVVRLRDTLLPLVRLADVLGVKRTFTDPRTRELKKDRRERIADRRSRKSIPFDSGSPESAGPQETQEIYPDRSPIDRRYRADSAINLAVVSEGSMKYGLVVDRLLDPEEIVVKPLGRHIKPCKAYAGATIMGDGRVALILDVANIRRLVGLSSVEETARAAEVVRQAMEGKLTENDAETMLIFKGAEDEHFAVPLNQVVRIQKIRTADVEEVGGRKVIQYLDGTLPLFSIDQVARVKPLPVKDRCLAIVFALGPREFGLMATGPVDTVQTTSKIDEYTLKQPGIVGSFIIAHRTTMVVDVLELVRTLNPEWLSLGETLGRPADTSTTVLVVEDSTFFRHQVRNMLEEHGCRVIEAEDGIAAWELMEKHFEDITLVLTDLEMPNLDGFALTGRIREDPRFSHLPIMALTTLADDRDMERGRHVGIDEYHIKLNREELLDSIDRLLESRRSGN